LTLDFKRLLQPRSIAVFGGHEAGRVIEQCERLGFNGELWPVNPHRETLAGRPCFRNADELPAAPDAVFIGVNRRATIGIVEQLAGMGAGGAVIYASGFAESADDPAAGRALQQQLIAAAGNMPILGPNCYGFINYLDRAPVWPDQHGGQPVARGVALITQSSNLTINLSMQRRGLPIAYIVAAGNQARIDLADIARQLLADPRVTAIGLHIEGIGNVRGFEQMAALARARNVPVVAVKPGRSTDAQALTLSHTASIAGSDTATDAFFERLGIARLESLPALLETLKLLHIHGPLPGRSIGSMSCSGGDAALLADAARKHDVALPGLSNTDRERIAATLDDIVTVSNPLDYHTFIWARQDALEQTFKAVAACDFDLLTLILDLPRGDVCNDADWMASAEALMATARQTGRRTALVATLPETLPEALAQRLLAADIAPLVGLDEAMTAIATAADIGRAWQAPQARPLLAIDAGAQAQRQVCGEHAAKQRLAAHGVPVPDGRVVQSGTEAVQAAADIGYPVVAKATHLAHKSEHGGVHLGLASHVSVQSAADTLLAGGKHVLIERMAEQAVAELVVGITREPQFGLMLTLGAGGVWVELLQDAVSLLLPTTRAALQEALDSLRLAPLLRAYRGRPAADEAALIEALLGVCRFAEQQAGSLLELDINPLLVLPAGQGVVAADALLVEEPQPPSEVSATLPASPCSM